MRKWDTEQVIVADRRARCAQGLWAHPARQALLAQQECPVPRGEMEGITSKEGRKIEKTIHLLWSEIPSEKELVCYLDRLLGWV